ncbi:hypothetical protein QM574_00295 [Pantoea ananatis]|uniref:hypothetical protein n=1 Tax=Pantoea TaxID=53335 RepID=UPI0024B6C69D|nr:MULTISPECIES: hypothetical protein [Pantoea]MDJ0042519.1 hypothetical protein [Pantoea allii]MDJ0043029.1 hypothetical protein [Pantoea ananatis]
MIYPSKNTLSDHPVQDNSLQTRTVRLRMGFEPGAGLIQMEDKAIISQAAFTVLLSSHPTQDFILPFSCFKTCGYAENNAAF